MTARPLPGRECCGRYTLPSGSAVLFAITAMFKLGLLGMEQNWLFRSKCSLRFGEKGEEMIKQMKMG